MDMIMIMIMDMMMLTLTMTKIAYLRWMDMMARTHKKNLSTCRKDSPRFL